MNERYKIGDKVLGSWTLVRLIGEGSFGKVFEARREDFGVSYSAAIKIITIPQSKSEIANARSEGMDDASVTAYFRSFVEDIVQEFALMSRLKGTANVVSYEDHAVISHDDGIGWDIIIRMELLTPLLDYTVDHTLTRKDVIQLGIDLCKALELCQKYNIVHRDIKPENIFLSELGDFKLGDFGIARTVEKTSGALSKKGTYTYMAPEVYREEPYNSTVDIYSLGIVLYRLLNDNRAPFLPEYPAPITHSSRESALFKRISGAALPAPRNADGRLAEIVLKACAFRPTDRYSSPMEMRGELEAIQYQRSEAPVIYPQGDAVPLNSLREIPTGRSVDAAEETVCIFSAVPAAATDGDQTVGMFASAPVKSEPVRPTDVPKAAPNASEEAPKKKSVQDDERTFGVFGNSPEPVNEPAAAPESAFDISGASEKVPFTEEPSAEAERPSRKPKGRKLLIMLAAVVSLLALLIIVSSLSRGKPQASHSTDTPKAEPLQSDINSADDEIPQGKSIQETEQSPVTFVFESLLDTSWGDDEYTINAYVNSSQPIALASIMVYDTVGNRVFDSDRRWENFDAGAYCFSASIGGVNTDGTTYGNFIPGNSYRCTSGVELVDGSCYYSDEYWFVYSLEGSRFLAG